MELTPIFDTNVFLAASNGQISETLWRRLMRSRPSNGWPLSAVTLAELLIGLRKSDARFFDQSQLALRLARTSSKGHVLEQPTRLLRGILFSNPDYGLAMPGQQVSDIVDAVCRARNMHELTSGTVPYKPSIYRGKRGIGVRLDAIEKRLSDYLASETQHITELLDKVNPDWRETRSTEGASLPERERTSLRSTHPIERWKRALARGFAGKFDAHLTDPEVLAFVQRFDAAVTFLAEVIRKTLTSNYRHELHVTDHCDFLQLLYLENPRCCLVTRDKRLIQNVVASSQASRVLNFESFVLAL